MSNLGDLLKQITGNDDKAVSAVGNVIGTVADLAGAVGAVAGIITSVVQSIDDFISADQQIISMLNDIESQIRTSFAALNAELRAEHILAKLNSLDPAIAQAQAVIDQLKDDLSKKPPLDNEYRLQQIGLCIDAVEQLNQDDKWLTNYADEIYYGSSLGSSTGESAATDLWTGMLAPTPNPDGTVFTTRYILADFLRVLYQFMLVAAAFEGNFQTHYQTPLRNYTARLQTVYDTSKPALVTIRKPTQAEFGISNELYNATTLWGGVDQTWAGGSGSLAGPTLTNLLNNGARWPYVDGLIGEPPKWHSDFIGPSQLLWGPKGATTPGHCYETGDDTDPSWGYYQEYGVVHVYTGYNAISNYPPVPLPAVKPDVYWPQFMASLNLAIRRNYKQAYAAVGLSTVWTTINALKGLTGDPPLGPHDPDVVWTLGEVGKIFSTAFLGPKAPAAHGTSMADVISGFSTITASMQQTVTGAQPAPPLTRPLSFRGELKKALDAVTFTCTPGGTPPPPINLE